jgi:hypothetical protein
LFEVNDGDGILLAVDDFLRQREIEFGKRDRLHDRAKRFHRSLDLQLGRRADLQAGDIFRRIDRPYAVRQVAESVFPIAQQDEALLLGKRREPSE